MKVKEMIKELSRLNPDAEVVYLDDSGSSQRIDLVSEDEEDNKLVQIM